MAQALKTIYGFKYCTLHVEILSEMVWKQLTELPVLQIHGDVFKGKILQ